jgi:hypothetical protein
MKLDPGYYVIEVQGHEQPVYVAYDMEPAWPLYRAVREGGGQKIGPLIVPGVARLPIGVYRAQGGNFEFAFECRRDERAVFEHPTYSRLPQMLQPAQGVAW